MTSHRPVPVIGLRRRQRVSGEPYLHAIVDSDLLLPAGTALQLRRLHAGDLDGSPEFALVIVPPAGPLTAQQRRQAALDRLDGSAIRLEVDADGGGRR